MDDSVIMSLQDKQMCVFLDHLAFKIPAKENCGKGVIFLILRFEFGDSVYSIEWRVYHTRVAQWVAQKLNILTICYYFIYLYIL